MQKKIEELEYELQQLHRERALHQMIEKERSDAVFVCDSEGELLFVSSNAASITGWPGDAFSGTANIRDLVGDGIFAEQRLHPDSEIRDRQVWVKTLDGNQRLLLVNGKQLAGQGDSFLFSCRQPAAEIQIATEQNQSVEKYQGIFDDSIAAIYIFDNDKNFIDSNQAGLSLLGYSRAELLQLSIPDVDADPLVVLPAHQQLLEGDKLINYEHQLIRKDGTTITVLNNSRPLRDDRGLVTGMLSTLIDITERKAAEEVIVHHANFETIINKNFSNLVGSKGAEIDSGIYEILLEIGQYTGVDRVYLFQSRSDEPDLMDNTHEWCRAGIEPQIARLQGIPMRRDLPWFFQQIQNQPIIDIPDTRGLGAEANLEREHFIDQDIQSLIVVPITGNGVLKGFLGFDSVRRKRTWSSTEKTLLKIIAETIGNALERRAADARLEIEKSRAERSDRLKSAFLANISHEIRTPLNAIVGYTDLAAQLDLPTDARQHLGIVKSSCDLLLHILNDILDVSRIEAGLVEIHVQPVSLPRLIRETRAQVAMLAEQYNSAVPVSYTCGNDIAEYVHLDDQRIRQVLTNLLANALKFTAQGEISFAVQLQNEDTLEFQVVDTGRGIAADQIEAVFEPFVQADSGDTRKYGGVGLGLTICKHYIQLMGGEIRVKSVPNKGTTFCFTVPYKPDYNLATGPADSETMPGTVAGKRVLVVEDDPVSLKLTQAILEQAGCIVSTAPDGQVAVEACQNELAFDCIVMDIQMPVKSGLDAVREIRAILEREGQVNLMPIIALSAAAMVGDKEKGLQAGFTDYLTKPVNRLELLRTLQQYLV
ncbi:MAG: PAS domain S-box protein [Leptospiraceae bacterium]|nr:PAS domain S-box protein [Leptospiraceae bacterium]